MEKFIIEGPCVLKGDLKVSGSKNAALPIIAATILAKGKYQISNIPMILDIENMLSILDDLGARTTLKNNICTIDTTDINSFEPDARKVRNIRASILLLGPLLARFNEVVLDQPGGCFIGARPVSTHLAALIDLGAKQIESPDSYHFRATGLLGAKIKIEKFSVTGTENTIMAAVLAKGTTEIQNAATEPHVIDLCNFLIKMGANISGIGTHNLTIQGVQALSSADYKIIPDQIEAGTFVIAAAATKGQVKISGFIKEHQKSFLQKLDDINIEYSFPEEDVIEITDATNLRATNIVTGVSPGFPTDLQAPFGVLITQARGTSTINETVFEGRLSYLKELNKMGANCVIDNDHEASVTGPTPLTGTTIESFDLRAGATLLIASLIAKGESTIEKAERIDRGYEKIDERLNALGAKIRRVTAE